MLLQSVYTLLHIACTMLHNANTLLRGASTMLHCVYMLCALPTQKRESVGVGLCLGRRHGRSPDTTLGVQLLDSLSLTRSVALLAVCAYCYIQYSAGMRSQMMLNESSQSLILNC